jgi:ribosomal protein S12 methylthiotransferase accessory factor
LTVAISTQTEAQWRYAVAEHCAASGSRWVDVVLDPGHGVRLGPLSRRDWSVCTGCAERRIAAARAKEPLLAPAFLDRLCQIGDALLSRELDALNDDVTGGGLLREHVLSLDSTGTTLTLHRVIALPDCPFCAGPMPRTVGSGIVADTVTGVLTRLGGWVDPLTGVIPSIRLDQPLGSGRNLPTIATAAAPRILLGAAIRELPIGWGKGLSDATAVVSAVGEAVERYSASLPDDARITWCRPADLDGDVLLPEQFPLYTDEQYARPEFPFVRWDPELVHPWVRGHWYGSDRPVWVPAVLSYLHLRLRPHQLIVQGSCRRSRGRRADRTRRLPHRLADRPRAVGDRPRQRAGVPPGNPGRTG